VFGGRFENTSTDVSRFRRSGTGANLTDFARLSQSGDYDNFLPSVTFGYDLTESLKFRVGIAQAVGRPNPSDLGGADTVAANGDVTRGNPNLKAREGDSLDLSLEYYFPRNGGVASIGVFKKSIQNEIFRLLTQENVNGVVTTISQPQNASASQVSGLELNFIRNNLDFLPGFLKNFGFSANATFLEAETTILGATGASLTVNQLPGQADFLANAAIFYENGPFRTRLSYAYVDAYKSAIGLTSATDRTEGEAIQYDLQARYSFGDRFEIIAEVKNLTNEEKVAFTGPNQNIARDINRYGRQFWVGAAFKY
jgi:iron complex outermembrane recepter protein